MAIPLWDPNHPRGQVFMRKRHDLMSKLNDALPDLREMNINGLWAILPKYHVMDIATMERCRAGGISADQIERVVEFLKNDQVWKFHAFVKTLYDIGRCAYIDILLGDGASTNYEDQPAKHTDMAIPLWDPNHPDGRVFLRNRDDLMSRLNDTLPYLREMDTEGLWASLQKYKVMDRTTLQKCQAGEISADKIERVVIFLKKDQVWKFHAFVKALYDTHQTAYIDTLLGEGASKTYADQPAKHTDADAEFDATAESIRTELKDSMTRLKGPQGFGALTEAPMVIELMEKLGILTSAMVVEVEAATTQSEKVEKLIQHLLTSAPSKLVLFAWLLVAYGHTHQLPASITTYVASTLQRYNEDQIIIWARRYEAKLIGEKGTATKTAEEPTKETHAVEPPSTSTMTSAEGASPFEKPSSGPHVAAEVSVATTTGRVHTAKLTGDKGTTTKTAEEPTKETHAGDPVPFELNNGKMHFGKSQLSSQKKQDLEVSYEKNHSMRKMRFEQAILTDEVADHLISFFENNHTLQTLDFSCTNISDPSMIKLFRALKQNKTLVNLEFGKSEFNDRMVEDLCQFIVKNRVMMTLGLNFSSFTNDDFSTLLKALADDTKFKSLEFCSSKLTGEAIKALCILIKKNQVMKELWFINDELTNKEVSELVKSLVEDDLQTLEEMWIYIETAGDGYIAELKGLIGKGYTTVRSVNMGEGLCLKAEKGSIGNHLEETDEMGIQIRGKAYPSYYSIRKEHGKIEIKPMEPDEESLITTELQDDGPKPQNGKYFTGPKQDSSCGTEDDMYEMREGKHGMCHVINVSFTNNTKQYREGSHEDYESFMELFEKHLIFDVTGYTDESGNDVSEKGICESVKNFFNNKEHRECDCAVLCIMTHGGNGIISGSDGRHINLEDLYTFIEGIPTLRDKPKLVFLQACSGSTQDTGQGTGRQRTNNHQPLFGDPLPTRSDMFIACPSLQGFVSKRNIYEGSWFIQEIKKNFKDYAATEHLEELMIRVRKGVAWKKVWKVTKTNIPTHIKVVVGKEGDHVVLRDTENKSSRPLKTEEKGVARRTVQVKNKTSTYDVVIDLVKQMPDVHSYLLKKLYFFPEKIK